MKKTFIVLLITLTATSISFSKTYIINNSGTSFSPGSITINVGDTVKFVLESIHNAREVSQATWNANGTTSNGGFDLPNGGGIVVLNQVGIHYYVCVPHASFGMKGTITVNNATDVKTISEIIPNNFILNQNYPNPFNPSTSITYSLPNTGYITLEVFNMIGQRVATLIDGIENAGSHQIQFNANKIASGIYFYRIQFNSLTLTKRMMLMK
ncbi:MAG: T9SS type A sorting domain-containing protein [Ignavibacteriales bacterium]|nr:T9SS type A sorting domain-containing protein [Ignavibacteriales bacterium]